MGAFFRALFPVPVLLLMTACQTMPTATRSDQFDITEATIADIHAAFADGRLDAVTLVQHSLARIEAYDRAGPRINSIITVNEQALADAERLDEAFVANGLTGPLHGIPVLLKDNIDAVGMPVSNGSAILRNSIPVNDAPLTAALREAGAIILGKASMGEFASGSYNSVSGQTLNPYNTKRDTGGSSSGSAAAIAANFAVLAVGTDTSTSVRGPAALNGIVGLRPTTGLISRTGIAPKDLEFDTAGPMARTVADVARMLSVMAAPDEKDPLSGPIWNEMALHYKIIDEHVDFTRYLDPAALKGRRVGVLRDFFGGDPEIDALTEAALKQVESLGATLVDIRLETDFMKRYTGKGQAQIRDTADYRFRRDWEAYAATLPGAPPTVAELVALYENEVNKSALPATEGTLELLRDSLKTSTSDPAYIKLVNETLPKATADKLAVFEKHKVDVLVFPYATSFAGVVKNPVYQLEDPTFVASKVPAPATLAGYNSTGFPSMVVPMGFGSQGLPMGLGFMARPFDDGPLIGYAYAYEQASRQRRPSPLLPALP